jgi:phosphatidate cytidylyltransferase
MLKQRILTACILIPIALAVLFYLPPFSFRFLTAFIALGGAWEWSGLIGLKKTHHCFAYVIVVACAFFLSLLIPNVLMLGGALLWWLLATVLILFYPSGSRYWNHKIVQGGMGLFVLVPCWFALNFMRSQTDGLYALLFLFILIWGADSAAYFSGTLWAKHKLAPRVSPGKSWQGLGGALIFSTFIVGLTVWFAEVPMALWPWALLLSLATVLFSVIGDLFESMLKREAGVKDSGHLLPGHGGLLDRIDSLTAAAPIFALGAWLLGTYVN